MSENPKKSCRTVRHNNNVSLLRAMKPSPRFWFAILIAVGCLSACYIFWFRPLAASLSRIPMADDAERSRALCLYVVSRVHFDGRSATDPDKSPVYWDAFRNSARLIVYGVTNTERQAEVLAAVRDWQATNLVVTNINVRFFERENWRSFTNAQAGYSGGDRLPETLLREEFVK